MVLLLELLAPTSFLPRVRGRMKEGDSSGCVEMTMKQRLEEGLN
jgi:hypothetical protein